MANVRRRPSTLTNGQPLLPVYQSSYDTLFSVLAFVSTLTELNFTMTKKIEPGVAPQVIFYLTCLLSLDLFITETLETIRVGVFECTPYFGTSKDF